ncbi:MAG: biopolymer transporter ExbD [Cytophagales bacterium]|nr:biopolymer transporter ExbD [Cytophagales bacterium]
MADIQPTARTGKAAIRLDMTPMVDLAFLLITFFMLTTTFSKARVMNLQMPEKDPERPVEVHYRVTVSFVLDEQNRVFAIRGIDNPDVTLTNYAADGLRKICHETLKKGREYKKDAVFLIKPTSEATYQNVVDALDEMKITEAKVYAIQSVTPAESELVANYKKAYGL